MLGTLKPKNRRTVGDAPVLYDKQLRRGRPGHSREEAEVTDVRALQDSAGDVSGVPWEASRGERVAFPIRAVNDPSLRGREAVRPDERADVVRAFGPTVGMATCLPDSRWIW